MMAAASAQGATAITIEIGGAVVRAAPGVDPAWLSVRLKTCGVVGIICVSKEAV
jgi:hypothetical protein